MSEPTAAKAAFVAKHGEPSAEQWLNRRKVCARTRARHLLIEAVHELELPVCAPPEQRARFTTLLPACTTT